ncbi:s-cell enriched with leucine-rich repeat-containing protein slra-related [Holotrichia oblita]|uniref:S-cell enriched with leucine-rich repeat-containing protein slra-related n=1 Tax=Holotrichia oblita TaxID=644536 RepID=A0ACB9T8J2_HOLOL|nr:s-cell enriched with leucine-rich repeat-containing protein slra-related [Holotrichia oblita]
MNDNCIQFAHKAIVKSHAKHITNKINVTFQPSHVCDNENCSCILEIKQHIIVNKIVHLNLSNCNLKLLPDSLSELPLKSLNLSHNSIVHIPSCLLNGLESIEDLNLSYNQISEFEVEPKSILNLQVLDVRCNDMKYIPIWLVHAKSRSLLELYYSCNVLGKTNENLYAKIYSYDLRKLVLKDSYILNENISFLKSIRTLEVLDVANGGCKTYRNCFTNCDELLDHPSWENTIKILSMSSLNMGFFPKNMICLQSLKELYIADNALFWLPDVIGKLVALEILDISNNNIYFLPNIISDLKNLRVLKLQHNKLTDIKLLGELVNLKLLDLYENDLDSFHLDISKFKCLDLEKNCFDTSLLDNIYSEKRFYYRNEYNLKFRDIGYNEEHSTDFNKSESDCDCIYSEDSGSSNVIPCDNYKEECWDDIKIESHPDVTSSDDEWQGYFPTQQEEQKQKSQKSCLSLERLLEDLYADVD